MTARASAGGDNTSLHQQILSEFERRIVSGQWPPGHRLPFEVDLAKSFGVSRMTMNKVLTRLADAGLIERRKRSGSFVAQPQVQSAVLEIHTIESEVRSLGRDYAHAITGRKVRKAGADELAGMGLDHAQQVLELRCLHRAGPAPFCIEYRIVNLAVVPDIATADFSAVPPDQWLQKSVPWTSAEHKITAIAADRETANALGIAIGSPCLVVQRQTWIGRGAVTLVRFTYPAANHAIVAAFTPASSHTPTRPERQKSS
jgi:GntR family histidine utilization transcriptional repressor